MLYLVPTPIGNLEDMTFRSIKVLNQVSRIFAEDTRHTLGLLRHFNIQTPLSACHQHNERECAKKIIALLEAGDDIALVSDAGLPGISDPGHVVVSALVEANLPFTVLPGASAATTALILSGLPCDQFVFMGFLPRINKKRNEFFMQLQAESRTSIIYESPFRLGNTLLELSKQLGEERPAAVCRELTKMHEECVRGTLSELADFYTETPKGECVIVIAGQPQTHIEEANIEALLLQMHDWILQGKKPKEAAKLSANAACSANQLYQAYIEQKNES